MRCRALFSFSSLVPCDSGLHFPRNGLGHEVPGTQRCLPRRSQHTLRRELRNVEARDPIEETRGHVARAEKTKSERRAQAATKLGSKIGFRNRVLLTALSSTKDRAPQKGRPGRVGRDPVDPAQVVLLHQPGEPEEEPRIERQAKDHRIEEGQRKEGCEQGSLERRRRGRAAKGADQLREYPET